MRRSDREITEFKEIISIMEKCNVCRIALNNSGYPYILPLNFGIKVDGDKVELYFHGASEGTKYDLISADNRASFEMDCEHKLISDPVSCYCTMEYESIIGHGHIEMLSDDEKYDALCILMKHYHQEEFAFSTAAMPRTKVFKLVVDSMTAKSKLKK